MHKMLFVQILLLIGVSAFTQDYPPSCAVTMPHSNAYFKEGTDVVIKVFASDIGKSTNNGTVTSVEFFVDGEKIGEETNHDNFTYTIVWGCVTPGEYRITAKATNDKGVSFTSTGVFITVGTKDVTPHGMSAGKGKYLANIIPGSAGPKYNELWNGVTAENSCKWEAVERTRGSFSWGGADVTYNHAKNNNMIFRYHAAVWASQYPGWLTSLSTADAKAETIEYMEAIAKKYPYADQIDVLNEQLGNHQADNQKFRELYGGPGTGQNDFDWQIWLFTEARRIFPNTKLILNDYGLVNDRNAINQQLALLKVLRDRGIVDGFGTQSHCFNVDGISGSFLKESLDLMSEAGLPIYVTELDLNGGTANDNNESQQLQSYKDHFPVYWEHPSVAGITIWGYINGQTWRGGTGIMSSSGTPKQALTWLQDYVGGQEDVDYPFGQTDGCTSNNSPRVSIITPTSGTVLAVGDEVTIETKVEDTDDNVTLVEFFVDDEKIGEDDTSPYTATWTAENGGKFVISAKATDAEDNTGKGSASIEVKAPQGPYGGVAHAIPGKIEFEEFDTGGQDSAYYDEDPGTRVSPAPDFRSDEDVDIEICSDTGGGYNLGWTAAGEWLEYTVDVDKSGTYDIDIRVACEGTDRTIMLESNGKTLAEDIKIPNTGDWQKWETITVKKVKLSAGKQIIRLTIGDTDFVNLNYMEFIVDSLDPDPDENLKLTAGWNIIACVTEGTTKIETALSSIWDNVVTVKDMDVFYTKGNPEFVNLLKSLEWGKGYMIYVDSDCELTW